MCLISEGDVAGIRPCPDNLGIFVRRAVYVFIAFIFIEGSAASLFGPTIYGHCPAVGL